MRSHTRLILSLFTFLSILLSPLAGSASPYSATWTPTAPAEDLPSWITPYNDSLLISGFIGFSITPPEDQSHFALAITICFEDGNGGALRVLWKNPRADVLLCPDLLEGIKTSNQRTLLLDASLVGTGGLLTIESTDTAPPVTKVRCAWVVNENTLLEVGGPIPPLIIAGEKTVSASEFNGDRFAPSSDEVAGRVVRALLSENIEILSTAGLEFQTAIETAPAFARLEFLVSAPSLVQPPALVCNGTPLGAVSITWPPLSDPGWISGDDGTWRYSGWLKASAILPTGLLITGDNSILLGGDTLESQNLPALKNPVLELLFPARESSEAEDEEIPVAEKL